MAKNQRKQKGGRTQRLEIRVTPAEKEMLLKLAKKLYPDKNPKKSRTDAIITAVLNELERFNE